MGLPIDVFAPLRKVVASNLEAAFTADRFPQDDPLAAMSR